MLNSEHEGGGRASATTAPPNPFQSATQPQPQSQLANPFLKQAPNPFGPSNIPNTQAPIHNPFAPPTIVFNPFASAERLSPKRSASPPSKQAKGGRPAAYNPFDTAKQASSSEREKLPAARASVFAAVNGKKHVADFVQPAWPNRSGTATTDSDAEALVKREADLRAQMRLRKLLPNSANMNPKSRSATGFGQHSQGTVSNSIPNGSPEEHDGRSCELAAKIQQQLSKDRISPPSWPANPGSHSQRQVMESFRESYKLYRDKARKSLIKAGLVDDPNERRTLEQALDFRGISEDMCPEWEKVTRIIEYDLRNPEKAPDESGDLVAIPSLMVKRLARSAAGQDAPLPMDVRSFAALRRTLDYLIDDLIPDDSLLPSKHSFLWDRTRAIRIDLSVQKYNLTPDERADLLYCLETIARFHVTSLHLLSQSGFAADDFSEQQEIEQLGKTLISLKELYDDCVEQGIECPNEAEFRGYYIMFNARNPSIKETVEGWGSRLWNTDGIRTAMCLVESMQNTWTMQGPLHPYAPTELALDAAGIFFSIVSSPQISYTMACFAEIHFNDIRKSMLQMIRKAYTRPRDGPKDITPAFLKDRLRFDAEDSAVDFAQKHGFVFTNDGANRYAILNSRESIKDPRVRHTFSKDIVERKRSGRSLPDIIHHTVYEEDAGNPAATSESGMFVPEDEDNSSNVFDSLPNDDDTDSSHSTVSLSPQGATKTPFPSIFSPSTHIPKSQTHAHFTTPAPKPDGDFQPTKNPFAQSYNSPFGTHSSTTDASEWNQPSSSILTPDSQNASIISSQDSKSTPSSNTPSPNIFGFLQKGNDESPKPTASQSASTSIFGTLSKPSLFPSTNAGDKPPVIAAAKTTTTIPSSFLAPSSTPTPSLSPGASGTLSLFQQSPPKVATSDGSAPVHGQGLFTSPSQPILSSPPANPASDTPKSSLSVTNSMSKLPNAQQEKPDGVQRIPSIAAPAPAIPKRDPMGDFTRWFVLGDNGLMEKELEEFAVEHFLKSTWEEFQASEKDRIRKEEDAQSWAEALKYRHYSLKVTFFYRWLDIIRKRRIIKRIKLEKEKARKWKAADSVAARKIAEKAEKEKAIQEAKDLVVRRSLEHARETMMRESTRSRDSLEEALLATGVFSGVRDDKTAAHDVVQYDNVDSEADTLPEEDESQAEKLRLRAENQRRRMRGLPPLKRLPEAKEQKEGKKTALLRALSRGAGRDSLSMSTGSLRHSTMSSGYRSSLGFNHSRIAKPRSSVSDPYWKMKANGLVLMPNGEYLHESLALPMLQEGKRFPGLGDYGLPPVRSFTPSQSPPAGADFTAPSASPIPIGLPGSSRRSRSLSIYEAATQKRKRGQPEDDDLTAYRNETPTNRKRTKSSNRDVSVTPSEDQDFLASIANLLNKVDAVAKSTTQ
ncbi:hypothetical protein GGR50DRAFT_705541 [Xylaria sp. CBS 124048]|nr:hypothetical protein GGR50DRAFT_705541 [Xylaria sp. CBS 124048]